MREEGPAVTGTGMGKPKPNLERHIRELDQVRLSSGTRYSVLADGDGGWLR